MKNSNTKNTPVGFGDIPIDELKPGMILIDYSGHDFTVIEIQTETTSPILEKRVYLQCPSLAVIGFSQKEINEDFKSVWNF